MAVAKTIPHASFRNSNRKLLTGPSIPRHYLNSPITTSLLTVAQVLAEPAPMNKSYAQSPVKHPSPELTHALPEQRG